MDIQRMAKGPAQSQPNTMRSRGKRQGTIEKKQRAIECRPLSWLSRRQSVSRLDNIVLSLVPEGAIGHSANSRLRSIHADCLHMRQGGVLFHTLNIYGRWLHDICRSGHSSTHNIRQHTRNTIPSYTYTSTVRALHTKDLH